jgi:hypothetical protein
VAACEVDNLLLGHSGNAVELLYLSLPVASVDECVDISVGTLLVVVERLQEFEFHVVDDSNERGELLNFMLTKANVDDRNTDVFNRLSDNVFGKLFADKGYISHGLFERLFNDGIEIVTGLKCNMKNKLMPLYDKILLRKRSVIETINDELKNVAQLVHSRHRSVFNFVMNVLSVLAAYSFFEKKPSINIDYCIENVDGQLAVIK